MQERTESLRYRNSTVSDHGNDQETVQTKEEVPLEIIKSFGSYTTLHGFQFLIQSSSSVRRVIWLVLMVVCLVVLVVQMRENYRKIKQFESVVTKSIEHSEKLRFPAVTICNQNMLRKSKILGTEAQRYLDGLDVLKRRSADVLGKLQTAQVKRNSSFDIEKVVREAGHNLSTMMKTCRWNKEKCGPENFTVSVSFNRGLCYTFNSGAPGHPVLYVSSSGITQSLSLMIDVQPDEYYGPFSYDATGLKVLVHDQSEWPDIENCADDVSPGQNTNIRITRNKIIYLKPLFTPACGERKLATSKTYSFNRCLLECYAKITVEACHCRYLSMPFGMDLNVSHDCSTEELNNCVLPVFGSFSPNKCDCLLKCEDFKYSKQLSSAYFPSAHFWDTVFQLVNYSTNNTKIKSNLQEEIRSRLLKVNIFYESLSTEVTREKPAYDISDFASDMGGSMGLFLGCSLLTVCEFLDLLVILFLKCFRKCQLCLRR